MKSKGLRSQREFVRALLELLAIEDYDTITISQICKKAGYNRVTFYQNYGDKDELLNEIIDTKLNEMVETLRKVHNIYPDESFSRQNKVEALLLLFDYMLENVHFFKVVLKDNKIIGFRQKMFDAYKASVEESFISPLYNPDNDPGINDFYLMYATSAALGVLLYWINEGLDKSPKYVTEQLNMITEIRPHDLILGTIPFRKSILEVKDVETDPRILRTKQALKNSLVSLMKNHHYTMIKVNDITNHAEYNRSTFYSHYKDKDQLYQDILADFVNGIISALKSNPQINKIDEEQSTPLHHIFAYIYQNRTLLEIMYSDKKVPGFFNFMYNRLIDMFYEELDGQIEVDTIIYCHYITSTLMSVIGHWILNKVKYSPSFLAELFIELLKKHPIKNPL
ncbi:TetR/AcrR family transcriptional regulator [Neobacillus niacini]|uniref:TetR/AcrR family transcriptional regulator n=1 Tax=Neobacillus niacini TaxID=86668 RepID=UPI003B0246F9